MNRELIYKEFQRSEESLKSAQKLFEDGLFADAVSRAYYACLHCTKAALLVEGVNVSSHRAVLRLFGEHLVKKGKIQKEYGKVLREEQEDREACDYDVFQTIESERAYQRVKDAEWFVERISTLFHKFSSRFY